MDDTKYHCRHLKMKGFPLNRTLFNIVLPPSMKALWSSYLKPGCSIAKGMLISRVHSYQVKTGLCDLAINSIEAHNRANTSRDK